MIRVLAATALIAMCAATAAGELGRVVPVLDVVNHLRLPLILALAGALIVAGLARAGRAALLLGTGALVLQGAYVVPEFVSAGARAQPPPSFVVASHNLRFRHADLALLARWVEEERVDVLMLQEVPWDASEVTSAFANRLPHRAFGRWNSVLILSRHPLEARNPAVATWTGPRGGAFPVARIVPPGRRPIDLVAVHATHPPPLREGQEAEFDWLAAVVRSLQRERVVVAGDFNLTPFSHRFGQLIDDLALARATVGLPSFPTRLPILPIDHVLHGAGFAPVSAALGPDTGSDHLPVIARFVER